MTQENKTNAQDNQKSAQQTNDPKNAVQMPGTNADPRKPVEPDTAKKDEHKTGTEYAAKDPSSSEIKSPSADQAPRH